MLVLAYLFPPTGGAGVQRIVKFVRFLALDGWDATVVTTRSTHYPANDPTLMSELPPATRVIRAHDPPVGRLAMRLFDGLGLARLTSAAAWPDDAVWWLPWAYHASLRVARRENPHAMLSTSPPFTAHLVASAVARRTGIPWIADFRDEWSDNSARIRPVPRFDRVEESLERRTLSRAARIVTVADYFRTGDSDGADDPRRVTIMNGVDEDDLLSLNGTRPPADRFVLTFVGTLYGERDPAPVLSAARRLAERGVIDPARFEIRLVGNVWLPAVESTGPIPLVQTGYVDHHAAVREMGSATALLFFAPDTTIAPSGKIFEYLAAEKPILCIARADNLASRLVREWTAGSLAEPSKPEEIERAIAGLYRGWEEGSLTAPGGVRDRTLHEYSRRRLASRLAALLDEVAGTGG